VFTAANPTPITLLLRCWHPRLRVRCIPRASSGQAVGTAQAIRRGVADRVLAGGFDSMVSPVGLAGFCL
jgi:hypothetical protein